MKPDARSDKLTLNWFSPLPPAETEVANHTARLLPAVARRARVTLWTNQPRFDRSLLRHAAAVKRYDPDQPLPWTDLNRSEWTIYELGNNAENHAAIWRASRAYPGIVVLHDQRLSEFFAGMYHVAGGDRHGYVAAMAQRYGPDAARDAEKFWHGRLPSGQMIERYPMTDLAVENAYGVVTHTGISRDAVAALGGPPVMLTPLPYGVTNRPRGGDARSNRPPHRLIVFGHLGGNRCLPAILQALATFPRRDAFRLDVFGRIAERPAIDQLLAQLRLGPLATVHGFAADEELDAALRRAHLAINLRNPTMGEASGSQLRIWDHALPTIVTRIGPYAALPPEAVAFVRPGHEVEDLHARWREFLADPARFAQMGRAGRHILETQHDPQSYADALVDFIGGLSGQRLRAAADGMADRAGAAMTGWGAAAPEESFGNVARAIRELTGLSPAPAEIAARPRSSSGRRRRPRQTVRA